VPSRIVAALQVGALLGTCGAGSVRLDPGACARDIAAVCAASSLQKRKKRVARNDAPGHKKGFWKMSRVSINAPVQLRPGRGARLA
jgi:hypothetical protein